eukprot:364354-Chlamydomonas_euryale.AAC.17
MPRNTASPRGPQHRLARCPATPPRQEARNTASPDAPQHRLARCPATLPRQEARNTASPDAPHHATPRWRAVRSSSKSTAKGQVTTGWRCEGKATE